jgi:hypothetical protein
MLGSPIALIVTAAVALGAYNLWLRLRGLRKPMVIGAHLMAGIGSLVVLVFYLKDANNGEGMAAGPFGNVAAALLALAVLSGLLGPILGRDSRRISNALLTAHATCGVAGFLTALAWVNRLGS